jgi:hypothetical protein
LDQHCQKNKVCKNENVATMKVLVVFCSGTRLLDPLIEDYLQTIIFNQVLEAITAQGSNPNLLDHIRFFNSLWNQASKKERTAASSEVVTSFLAAVRVYILHNVTVTWAQVRHPSFAEVLNSLGYLEKAHPSKDRFFRSLNLLLAPPEALATFLNFSPSSEELALELAGLFATAKLFRDSSGMELLSRDMISRRG